MTSKKSNYKFLLKGTLTTAGTTVAISNDLELDQEVTFTNASVVLRNRTGSVIERTKATATGGVLTFLKRGLEQGDTEVEDSDLKKERRDGTVGYVTMLAPQLLDRLEYTEFSNGITGGDYADAAARDAALGGDGVALHPYVGVFVQDEGVHYNYNTSTGQWEAVETGTVTPNASPTVAGKVELATDAEVTAGTNTGGSGPLVVQPSQLLHEIDVSSFDEVTPANTDEIRVNRGGDKKKIRAEALLEAPIRGDASDGSVTISTNTTLTKDMYYNVLTVNSGVTLNTGSFRIFANSVVNNGTIERNGNNGANGVGPVGGAGGAGLSVGTVGGSSAGGSGNSTPGTAITTIGGGNGGNGGSGGVGGVATAKTATLGSASIIYTPDNTEKTFIHRISVVDNSLNILLNGGAGGGGGVTNGGFSQRGGGGGGGGGVVLLQVKTITNNGTIRANGGNGGTGSGGGGGGGGGGVVCLVYSTLTLGTVQVNGGSGGGGGGAGSGTAGVAGKILRIKL